MPTASGRSASLGQGPDEANPYELQTQKDMCSHMSFAFKKMFVREAYKPSSVIGGHLSRPIVTGGFKRNPESSTGRLKRSFVSCCGWGLHRGRVARPRVSSYLTFPPLHVQSTCGISLLHFPWGRPRRVLPGTLPCAARTFLTPCGARPPGSLTNALDYNTFLHGCQRLTISKKAWR